MLRIPAVSGALGRTPTPLHPRLDHRIVTFVERPRRRPDRPSRRADRRRTNWMCLQPMLLDLPAPSAFDPPHITCTTPRPTSVINPGIRTGRDDRDTLLPKRPGEPHKPLEQGASRRPCFQAESIDNRSRRLLQAHKHPTTPRLAWRRPGGPATGHPLARRANPDGRVSSRWHVPTTRASGTALRSPATSAGHDASCSLLGSSSTSHQSSAPVNIMLAAVVVLTEALRPARRASPVSAPSVGLRPNSLFFKCFATGTSRSERCSRLAGWVGWLRDLVSCELGVTAIASSRSSPRSPQEAVVVTVVAVDGFNPSYQESHSSTTVLIFGILKWTPFVGPRSAGIKV
jgi:hypothetical protein